MVQHHLLLPCAHALAQHAGAGTHLQLDAAHVVLQAACLGGAGDHLAQLVGQPGLEHVLVDARLVDAGDDVLGIGVPGDHDAGDLGPELAHLLEELDARGARHALVAQDHVDGHVAAGGRLAVVQHLHRLVGGAGDMHFELVVEGAADGLDGQAFVVYNEDAVHAGTVSSGLRMGVGR